MTAAIPRTQAEDLVSKLSDLCEHQVDIDDVTSRRFKRDIEKAKGVDARNAFVALGLLALLEWDLPSIRSNFEAAMPLGDLTETLDQYATTLQMIGDYSNASNLIGQAYARARTDLRLLNKAINFSYLAGSFTRAKEFCDMYEKLLPNEVHPERGSIEQAITAIQRGGIAEATVEQCNRIAFDLLRERHIVFDQTSSEGDEVDGAVFLSISVSVDRDTVEELDTELGERLFDRVEGYNPNCYWVGYVPSAAFDGSVSVRRVA